MPRTAKPSPKTATSECCPRPARARARPTQPFVQLFKALADETRLEMVGLLAAERGELCVCDIEGHFELGQPTVSHHLRVLREAGLVAAERRGTWVYYSLLPAALDRLRAFRDLLKS